MKVPFYKRKWFIILIVLLVLGSIGSSSDKKKNTGSQSSSAAETSVAKKENVKETIAEEIVHEADVPEMDETEFRTSCQEVEYKAIARDPDAHAGEHVKVTVKVRDVANGGMFTGVKRYYKGWTNSDYDLWMGDMYWLLDNREEDVPGYFKVLEDDIITVYGVVHGAIPVKNYINGSTSDDVGIDVKFIDLIKE